MKMTLFRVAFAVLTLVSSLAFAGQQYSPSPGKISDDKQLVQAVASQKRQFYVEAGNLEVTKVLPDDNDGLPHQKWAAKMSNGQEVTIVYNSDMGERVPLHIGDKFGVGGEFIWTGKTGGLVHWVHEDPKGKRPDGYVYMNGVVYGDTDKGQNPARH